MKIVEGFSVYSPEPIDNRIVCATLSDMEQLRVSTRSYAGMLVTCVADGTAYILNADKSKFVPIKFSYEGDIYSTTETEIGTFAGQKLYRRMYKFSRTETLTPNDWFELEDIRVSISRVLNSYITSQSVDGESTYTFPMATLIMGGRVRVKTMVSGMAITPNSYLVLEYTK